MLKEKKAYGGTLLMKLKPDEVVTVENDSVALVLLKEAGVKIIQPFSITSTKI